MIKDLVVPITDTAGDANAVAVAIALATQENAHLAVLEFVNLPMPPTGPWGSGELGLGDLYNKFRDEAEKDAALWRERLSREAISLSSEVRVIESLFTESSDLAALHARYADLAVMTMATDTVRDASTIRDFFTSLLLESGRPVLLVPPGYAWRPTKHVVVAWQAKREAARALHDAMPFLRAAESIDVLEVGEAVGEAGDGQLPGADIATHLARHGLKVRVVVHLSVAESVGASLVMHAQDTGAELIVAGGYGHSRVREWILGGVTRELLSGACPVPILFSH
jgi:nucleotide-binding universal stress UspA family protein